MPSYRQNFFRLFAIFFVIAVPFIIVYSLGFNINLGSRQLGNTMSINIETLPRGADISNNGTKILETPSELRAGDNQVIGLNVSLSGYKTEKFLIWAAPGQNTSARITKLFLLPEKSDEINNFREDRQVTFLSDYQLLIRKGSSYFIQQYSFIGVQNQLESIVKIGFINPETSFNFQKLSSTTFWDSNNNIVINKSKEGWKIINLNIFPQKFISLVKLEDSNFLALADDGLLWQLNTDSQNFTFLDSQVQDLTFTLTPDNIWLRKNDQIIRLNRNVPDSNSFSLSDNVYSKFPKTISLLSNNAPSTSQMRVESLYQGLLIQLETDLYYIPDYKPDEWVKLAGDAMVFTTSGNSLFWLDSTNSLHTYNLHLKVRETISNLDSQNDSKNSAVKVIANTLVDNSSNKPDKSLKNTKLFYYSAWNRLMIYNQGKVVSVWFDKEIYNKNMLGYKPVDWIDQASCYPEVVDRYQFCLKDNKLFNYKNLSLW